MPPLDQCSSQEPGRTLFPMPPTPAGSPHPDGRPSSAATRLIQDKPEILDELELVTLLVSGHRTPGQAETLARALLAAFHHPDRILASSPGRLRAVPGMDNDAIVAIKTAEALAIRHAAARLPTNVNPMLNDYNTVIAYCRSRIAHKPHEELHVLYLDKKTRLIACELHRTGTIDNVAADLRDIIARALQLDASGLVLTHNHPSGDPHPSPADVQTTKKLKTAAACLDIRVIDHIVITPHDHCSLAALNLI